MPGAAAMDHYSLLRTIRLVDFKSYADATLHLAPLTLLIGPNSSGKSNLVEAIRILSRMARGQRVDEVFRDLREKDEHLRGDLLDLPRQGCTEFELGCAFEPVVERYDQYRVRVRADGRTARIVDESIWSDEQRVPLFQLKQAAAGHLHDVPVAYNNFARGPNKPEITCTDQQLILTQLLTPARFGSKRAQQAVPELCRALSAGLADTVILEADPREMRGYSLPDQHRLTLSGSNVSGVLERISHHDSFAWVMELIEDLPEQPIASLAFDTEPRGDVRVKLTETFGGTKRSWPATVLSDGTLRVLGIVAAVYSAPHGALVIIEEFDNGVHPSRAAGLLSRLLSIAKSRKLRLLLSTHNPAMLDAAPTEAVPWITCCYRDDDDGWSRLVRLQELDRFASLVAEGPLGYLLTRGRIEEYVHDKTTPDERRDAALAWLAELRAADE